MDLQQQYGARLRQKSEQFPDSRYFGYLCGIGSPDLESRILIEIPAYRDPELLKTMEAAVAMAANPERVCFAVCYQGDDDAEAELVAAFPRTKVKRFRAIEAPGLCAARYEAAKLWDGEEYVMHVDSHMRFASFWDVCVIDQYGRCPGTKKALSEYNTNYMPAKDMPVDAEWFDKSAFVGGRKVGFSYFQAGTHKARFTGKFPFPGPDPQEGAFIGGHFLFGRRDIDEDVPSDPDMFFTADEACIAMRLWTHGYRIWHPGVRCVYHLYYREVESRFSKGKASSGRSAREHDRMLKLFTDGLNPGFGGFGLGTARTDMEYYAFAGLNYRSAMASRFSYDGRIGMDHDEAGLAPVCIHGENINGDGHPMRGVRLDGAHADVFFVIVTAYKAHNDLVETVRSLYGNADFPERVRVCVVAQLTDDEWLDQVRDMGAMVVPCEAKGAGHAHYTGEEHIPDDAAYVLYSEEHMYYAYGWDTALAAYMHYCGKRAVISDWASGFDYDKPFPTEPSRGCIICAKGMMPNGHPLIQFGRMFDTGRPVRGAFLIGHNLVVPAGVAREVRHSPDMYLNSNESYMTYRYWCAGVDVYHAPWRYCYHHYAPARNGSGDGTKSKEHTFSSPRMKYLLGISGTDPGADPRFALDGNRTLAAFAAFTGADPISRTCSSRAWLGMFADDTGRGQPPAKPDCRKDGTAWRDRCDAVAKPVDFAAVHGMDRRGLEGLCSGSGPVIGVWREGVLLSEGGCILGVPGSKLQVLNGARVVLHGNARLFLLGNMTVSSNAVVEVHPDADLVVGPGYINANSVVDCWKRIDLVDTIVAPNAFISDGFACDARAADGRHLMPVEPVYVGPHVWIASNTGVHPGTAMKDAAAGSMAYVRGSIGPRTVVAGDPLRVIREDCEWYG